MPPVQTPTWARSAWLALAAALAGLLLAGCQPQDVDPAKCATPDACAAADSAAHDTSPTDLAVADAAAADGAVAGSETVEDTGTPDAAPLADLQPAEVADSLDGDSDSVPESDVAQPPECVTATTCPAPAQDCQEPTCSAGQCGSQAAADFSPCSDKNAATTGDYCKSGVCIAGAVTVACTKQADCAKYEDGDECNGTLFCHQVLMQCQINPATVVTCPTASDTTCQKSICNPSTGQCQLTPQNELMPCEDGNLCTAGEACQAGTCAATASADVCACKKDADCSDWEDGNLCNGTMYCDLAAKVCKVNPATVKLCPPLTNHPCAAAVCEPATGKCATKPVLDGTPCEADNTLCTPKDACVSGVCVESPNVCDCTQDADCAAKEDGDLCNGTLYCDKQVGQCVVNPATLVTCPAAKNTACAHNTCDPKTGQCGLVESPTGTPCDDQNLCTAGDACQAGACVPGANTCACTSDANCKDDGDLCNGVLVCAKASGQCVVNPATVVVCPSVADTACLKNTCDKLTGNCAPLAVNLAGPCDDGDACTLGDTCNAAGQCVPGEDLCQCQLAADCTALDDDNPCNGVHYCDTQKVPFTCKIKSISILPKGAPCDDGNACTGPGSCSDASCQPGAAVPCTDNDPCTLDSCDPKAGCSHTASKGPCDDGDACNVGDNCSTGECTGSGKLVCDDGNPCTADACDPAASGACLHTPVAKGCDDGNACT
ncbi:MAG: hypothetical protein HY902_05510, partial [Deltaproteobacteria bacterium]|nr:hypothetical protein [Deltaproteobacteria bacterium]